VTDTPATGAIISLRGGLSLSNRMRILTRILSGLAGIVLLFLGVLVLAGATYHPTIEIPAGLKGKYITINGAPIRYSQTGSGPDVLLIHGSPGSLEDWDQVIAALGPSYRVTAYDRPGQGYSGVGNSDFSYKANADTAIALIDALHLHDVTVAGHSYGGSTAMAMALEHPTTVKDYVVVDSAIYRAIRQPDPMYHLLALPMVGTGFARTVVPLVIEGKIRSGIQAEFKGAVPSEEFLALRARIWAQPKVTTTIAIESLSSDSDAAELSPHYREVSAPLFILAQADNDARREAAERLHRDVAGSELLLLHDTGHYIPIQKARELAEVIARAAAVPRKGIQ
jgi:pimeloyl-ACP methyl ester carboxylesterase